MKNLEKTSSHSMPPIYLRSGCCRRRRATQNHGLAASLFDLLDGRLGKLVRVDGDRGGQFARAKNLDQSLLARCQTKLLVVIQANFSDLEIANRLCYPVQVHNCVFGAEDVGEAALWKPAVQRHLGARKLDRFFAIISSL